MVMSGYSCVDALVRFGKWGEVKARAPANFEVVGGEFVVAFGFLLAVRVLREMGTATPQQFQHSELVVPSASAQ
jgi:hypothetical protein